MSRIDQMFSERGPTASFEFFPPKDGEAWDALFAGISAFEQLQPSFVSVTYGAGGSTRARTHDFGGASANRDFLVAHASLDWPWAHQSRN